MNDNHLEIEFTHSDGEGNILMRVSVGEKESIFVLSREGAMTALAELAMAVSNEYGKFMSYGYPGCLAEKPEPVSESEIDYMKRLMSEKELKELAQSCLVVDVDRPESQLE